MTRKGGILLLLLLVCLGTRLGVLAQSRIIYQDSYHYIIKAKAFSEAPQETVSTIWIHPGYLAAMTGGHEVLSALGWGPDGLFGWQRAGEIVSLVASLLATVGLWVLIRKMFTPNVAWVSVLLFTCSKKWSLYGAAVLTESLAVCLQIWASVAVFYVSDSLGGTRRVLYSLAALTGLAIGVGYLTRIEAGFLLPVCLVFWMWSGRRQRLPLRRIGAACGITIAMTVLTVLPYAVSIGTISSKFLFNEFSQAIPPSGILMLAVTALTPAESFYGLIGAFTEAAHAMVAGLIYVYLAVLAARKLFRMDLPERATILPSREASWFIVLYLLLFIPIVVYRGTIDGLSARYLLFPAALLSGMAGATLVSGAALLSGLKGGLGKRPSVTERRILLSLVAVFCIAMQYNVHVRLRSESTIPKQAGLYLRDHVDPADFVICQDTRVAYYAGCQPIYLKSITGYAFTRDNGGYELLATGPEFHYMVMPQDKLEELCDEPLKKDKTPSVPKRYSITIEHEFEFAAPDGKTERNTLYQLTPLAPVPTNQPSVR